jgi:acyl-CoA dehydrogenase
MPDRDPLDLHLSERDVELLASSRAVAEEALAPIAQSAAPGRLNRALVKGLADAGLLDRLYSRTDDGSWTTTVSAIDLCLIREALAQASTEAETAFAVQGLGSFPMLQSGRPEVVGPWIERLAAGDAVAGFALTEPDAGTDVASLSLQARPEDDGYVLTGEKIWISNAPEADVYSVFARTTPGAGARGLTAFLVPRDLDGLGGEPLTLVSPHPIGRLIFKEAYVPAEYVLGEVDQGFAVAMQTLDLFRPSVGAFAIGMARAALDAAARYVNEREAFGKPLARQQTIAHRIADLATRLSAARLLVHQAAMAYDAGMRPVAHMAAMAKLLATELAQEAVDTAIQFHGARALEHGHLLEHLYREVRAPRIYEGASEIQREIIARHIFKSLAAQPASAG